MTNTTHGGREVLVTSVGSDPTGADYHLPDKQPVGEVVNFVRRVERWSHTPNGEARAPGWLKVTVGGVTTYRGR